MNFMDKVRERILKFLKIDKINGNPYAERLTFIGDEANIIEQQLKEYDVWYGGNSNELLNYYTNEAMYGNAREPIYNRNREEYFWALSSEECGIKRVHSGLPYAMITTLVNIIDTPKITIEDKSIQARIDNIIKKNDFINILNQQQMPLTLVEGWGAYKINFNKELSEVPLIQYYDAHDCEFIYKSGILLGIIYKDYYKANGKNYVLLETRRLNKEDGVFSSLIEYELFRLKGKNEVEPCELNEVPELAGLSNVIIKGYNRILGVPSKFFYDKDNKNYGASLFKNKIDLFDDLDLSLSQLSQAVRVSTPVEYIDIDAMERDKNGQPLRAKMFNRQLVNKPNIANGDGTLNEQIITTQPQINFDQYHQNNINIFNMILVGTMSPASFGVDIAKKDNADAQREKEKCTIMTRNNIINRQEIIIKDLMQICLDVEDYMNTGNITLQDYEIGVKFNEFANPSFENELQVLGNAWSNGQISTKKYVDLLWRDTISDEEKQIEIAKLEEAKQQDNLIMGDFEDETRIGEDLQSQEAND